MGFSGKLEMASKAKARADKNDIFTIGSKINEKIYQASSKGKYSIVQEVDVSPASVEELINWIESYGYKASYSQEDGEIFISWKLKENKATKFS